MELTKRTISRNPSEASYYFGNLLSWKIVLSLLSLCIIFISINFIKSEQDVKIVVYILGFAAVIKSLKTTSLIFFQALDKFNLYAYSQLFHSVLIFTAGLTVLLLGKGLIFFSAIFVSAKLLDLIISYIAVQKKIVPIKLKFDFGFIKKLQMTAIPFGLYAIIIEVYGYSGTIMLSLIKTNAEVGWYSASYKIFESLMLFPLILSQAVAPELFKLFKTNTKAHKELCNRVIKISFILSTIIFGLGILFSETIISLSFGKQFSSSVLPLQILFTGFIFSIPNFVFQTILISIDKQKVLMQIGLIALIINLVLNFTLIHFFGSPGAAFTTLISEAALFSLIYFYLSKKEFQFRILPVFLKLLIPTATIVILVFGLNIQIQFHHMLIMAALYLLALFSFKVFDQSELDIIKKVLAINSGSRNK